MSIGTRFEKPLQDDWIIDPETGEKRENPAPNTYGKYATEATWANANNAKIVDKSEYYETVAIPEPTDAELATQARGKRDFLINEIEWRVDRYKDQQALDMTTTDTPEQYKAILSYMQALRDIPSQSGFPRNIVWPSAPTFD